MAHYFDKFFHFFDDHIYPECDYCGNLGLNYEQQTVDNVIIIMQCPDCAIDKDVYENGYKTEIEQRGDFDEYTFVYNFE
jgi:hypothetical protein